MGFSGIGAGEVLFVLILALIIFGPGRLPEIGRTLGKTVRTFRKASFDFTSQITNELKEEEPSTGKTKEEEE